MTKQSKTMCITPITSSYYFPQYLYGAVVAENWLKADWWELAYASFPDLKLTFDNPSDWLLYRQIEALAADVSSPFPIAAHWVLRKALGTRYEVALEMDAGEIPWDLDLQYVCRYASLQLCKFHGPNDDISQGLVDYMIHPLLMPDEDLIYDLKPYNVRPC